MATSANQARFGETVRTALWVGLVLGLIEALVVLAAERVGRGPLLGPHFWWMGALANAGMFLGLGVVVGLVGRSGRGLSRTAAVGVLAFVAWFALVMLPHKLHTWAGVILAAGLAVQTARILVKRWTGFRSLVGHTWVPLLLLLGLSAAGDLAWGRIRDARALAALPPAAAGAPNVLLLVLDTVRGMSLSLYGYPRPTTPHIDRWAQSGVRFDRAIAPASWTLPTHASIFTGHWPGELSTGWTTPLDTTYPTLAEILSTAGYATAGFVANMPYGSPRFGLHRGFLHYRVFGFSAGEFLISTSLGRWLNERRLPREVIGYHDILGRSPAETVAQAYLDWLPTAGPRPVFAFLNFYDAHMPVLPPDDMEARFGARRPGHWDALEHLTHDVNPYGMLALWGPQETTDAQNSYDAAIATIDRTIGNLLDTLQRDGRLDNTVLIITADHGELIGEHGMFDHGNHLYRELVQVPLVIRFPPAVPAGAVVTQGVTLRDLPRTVLDLVGRHAEGTTLPGSSLARYWTEVAGAPEAIFSQVGSYEDGTDFTAVLRGNLHYIRKHGHGEMLFDWSTDPREQNDLSARPEAAPALAAARAVVDSFLASQSP